MSPSACFRATAAASASTTLSAKATDPAVVAKPDEKWGEAVKGLVELKQGMQTTSEELIAHCRQSIAGFKCPKSIEFIALGERATESKLPEILQALNENRPQAAAALHHPV